MKICIIGQCQGGNAQLWFDLLNHHLDEYDEIDELVYICRNPNALDAGSFKIVQLYGRKKNGGFKERIRTRIVSWIINKYFFRIYFKIHQFDVIHIQGNYTPRFNLALMACTTAKIVINIYGSDFYQNYLVSKDKRYRDEFEAVLERARIISCNWVTTEKDLVSTFPQWKDKVVMIPWGVNEKWTKTLSPAKSTGEIIFLSARGLYPYNNIDVLVEAFCRTYSKQTKYKLVILNGYGNDQVVVRKVADIIKFHGCEDQVTLQVNQWISDEELMAWYERANYNFCIGSTDQLTISIIYGLMKNTLNILSPLQNYYDLKDIGFTSPVIIDKLSVNDLISTFETLPAGNEKQIEADAIRAREYFIFKNNYKKYVQMYKKISSSLS